MESTPNNSEPKKKRNPYKKRKKDIDWDELYKIQDNLINDLKVKYDSLEIELEKCEERIMTLEIEKEEIEGKCTYDKVVLNNDFQRVKLENEQLSEKVQVFGNLPELPKDLSSVVNLIEKVQSDKLIFLTESKKSAKEAKFQDVCPSWSVLWKMSTTLWSLVFEEQSNNTHTQTEFKNQTGFDVEFSDGKMTNRDRKFQLLRKRIYGGKEIDITPHCKFDKAKLQLRIHFYLDYTKKLIVIGHCGNHLENYSTQKL